MSYTSTNGMFTYTITNNTNYVIEQIDYDIISSSVNRWESLVTIDTRFPTTQTITISFIIDTLDAGVLGGASITNSSYVDSYIFGNVIPLTANITMNNTYLQGLKTTIRNDGYSSYYHVLLHEIGHILGIGSFWYLTGCPKTSYDDNGTTKYYYTGTNAFREYNSCFAGFSNDAFLGIPIEDDGGAGTSGVHPEEGPEGGISADNRYINGILHPGLDTELMTGWLDGSPVSTPLSRISLGFLEDIGYTVNYNLADVYIMSWLATTDANNLEQTYIKGFLDVSGGDMINRNGNLSVLDGTMDVSGDVTFDSKLSVGGDVSFNGTTIDICGNLYAQYPINSIPSAAIDGLGDVTPNFTGDVDFQAGVTIATKAAIGDTTLPTATGTALKVTGDLDFTGSLLNNGSAFVSGATDLSGLSDVKVGGTNFTNSMLIGSTTTGTLSSAEQNTAVGIDIFSGLTNGKQNTMFGYKAGKVMTGGDYNTAIGNEALSSAHSTHSNTAIGNQSLKAAYSTGNTAVGNQSGYQISTGINNVCIGSGSGFQLSTGSYNTFLGNGADVDTNVTGYGDFEKSTAIGYGAKVTASNQIMLGTASQSVVAPGQVDICGNLYAQYDIVTPTIPAEAIIGGVGSNIFDSGDVSMNTKLSVGGDATFNSTLSVSGTFEKKAMLQSTIVDTVNISSPYNSQTWAESGNEISSNHDTQGNTLNRTAISKDGLFMLRRDNTKLKYRNTDTGAEVQITPNCVTYQMNDDGDTVVVARNNCFTAGDHEVWEKQENNTWSNVYTIASTTTATMSYDGTVICSHANNSTNVVMHKKTNGTWATNGTITLHNNSNNQSSWAPAMNANGTRVLFLTLTGGTKFYTYENNTTSAWNHNSSSTGTYYSQSINDAGQTISSAISDDGSYIAFGRWNSLNCPLQIMPWPTSNNWNTNITKSQNTANGTRMGKTISFRGSTSTGFVLAAVGHKESSYYIYASDGNPANLQQKITGYVGSQSSTWQENSIAVSGGLHRVLVGRETTNKIQLVSLPANEYSYTYLDTLQPTFSAKETYISSVIDASFNAQLYGNSITDGTASLTGGNLSGVTSIESDSALITATTPSTSTTTGALTIGGGLGVAGAIYIGENTTVNGTLNTNAIAMGGHMLPTTNAAYDLGNAEYKIRHCFLSDNSLWIGDDHKVDVSGGKMKFKKRKKDTVPASITTAGGNAENAKASKAGGAASSLSELTLLDWLSYAKSLDVAVGGTASADISIQDIYNNSNDADYETVQNADIVDSDLPLKHHLTINPIDVTVNVAGIQHADQSLKFTIPNSMTALKYFCTAHSGMIGDFILAGSTTETDKTYYVRIAPDANTDGTPDDPFYIFSDTPNGAALNDTAVAGSGTQLTLYKGNTYTFIKTNTNGHPFMVGESHNVTTSIKLESTGDGAATSSTYTNPYPLHVNGTANIEKNLNVARTLTVSGPIRQW